MFGYTPDEPATPWGTGAETPIDGQGLRQELGEIFDSKSVDDALMMRSRERRGSMLDQSTTRTTRKNVKRPVVRRKGFKNYWVPLVGKTVAMGIVGVGYGVIVSHLHDRRKLAPVQVDGIPHDSIYYLAFWGLVGITLGWLMPYVDTIWNGEDEEDDVASAEYRRTSNGSSKSVQQRRDERRGGWAPMWNDLVRTTGALGGVAFAIVSTFSLHNPIDSTIEVESGNGLYPLTPHLLTAPYPMALNPPTLTNPRPRKPNPLVPPRPQRSRLHPQHHRRLIWHRAAARHKPRSGTSTSTTRFQ